MRVSVNISIEDGQTPDVDVTVEPEPEPAQPTLVVCKDGTESPSGGKPGACAWHGGVDWSA